MSKSGNTIESVQIDQKEWHRFSEKVKSIPEKFQRKALLPVLRKGTKATVQTLKRNVSKHEASGNLYDSVGTITGRSKEFPNILVGYRVSGSYSGFHGHLVEHGTKDRYRKRKKITAAATFRSKRMSTGKMPALNLVEKSAEESESQAVASLEKEMKKFTEKQLAKHFTYKL